MNIETIISHWMPHDFKNAINPPTSLEEAKLIVANNIEVSCLAIEHRNGRYLFTEILCVNKTCINRSKFVFNNIKKIILDNAIEIKNIKFIFHFKGDACNIQKQYFSLLANSRIPRNDDVILWPLCTEKNVFLHDEINKYLKYPDTLTWDQKKTIFIFRGRNSGNPFSSVQLKWNKDRASRCDLLLEYLKLPEKLKSIVDIGFNKLYPNHFKLFFNKNNINYLESQFLKNLKDGKTIYDLKNELAVVFKYIKPSIKMKVLFNYKYIICPEGFDCSSALCWVLASNSLAIVPPFHYENSIISSALLKPYIHFLPIKEDYSNLEEIIQWAIDNDEKCKSIVQNANEYMQLFIKKDSMMLIQKTVIEKILR